PAAGAPGHDALPAAAGAGGEGGSGAEPASRAVVATSPAAAFAASVVAPRDGSTVGVGMPLSLRFSRPITDRAAVERAVTVSTEPAVPVAGHWFGAQRLDLRPQRYWRPGTRVSVLLAFQDVPGGPGAGGTPSRRLTFTVGRSQISTVDLDAHTLTVRQDGRVVRTLPVSAGNADHRTYQGVMVISEKSAVTRMNSQTVGMGDEYDIKDVPHAMRLTASGTFLHGNYWADPGIFGSANTSHGCVGLADARGGSPDSPAGWLFGHSLLGDVVEVRSRAGGDPVPPENGLNGWNLPWDQWLAGSALPAR
ncbi:L,D-transpeptidase, partial [Kitasatospora nipponensis]|uniref:L,D-transpeptidase n=1 Tax=Kitasatospora nipponensis TaxID=258049 RepID=UPI0031D9CCA2